MQPGVCSPFTIWRTRLICPGLASRARVVLSPTAGDGSGGAEVKSRIKSSTPNRSYPQCHGFRANPASLQVEPRRGGVRIVKAIAFGDDLIEASGVIPQMNGRYGGK
jgi:hypothetical protein